jgi:hypothetical protein
MKISSSQQLPENYSLYKLLDIRERKNLIKVNLWGIALLAFSIFVFPLLAAWLRPDLADGTVVFKLEGLSGIFKVLGMVLGVTIVMLLLHEGLHGICFWYFTRSRPKFAFKGVYAYAAAPGWYLPKGAYLITALAPLVGITLLCMLGLVLLPAWAISPMIWMLILNTSGAVGDLWVVTALLRAPSTVLCQDHGDFVEMYLPRE